MNERHHKKRGWARWDGIQWASFKPILCDSMLWSTYPIQDIAVTSAVQTLTESLLSELRDKPLDQQINKKNRHYEKSVSKMGLNSMSKHQTHNLWFHCMIYLPKLSSCSDVSSPNSDGIAPVSSLVSGATNKQKWEASDKEGVCKMGLNSMSKHQTHNLWFHCMMYLPKSRCSSDVSSPNSDGIDPVSLLLSAPATKQKVETSQEEGMSKMGLNSMSKLQTHTLWFHVMIYLPKSRCSSDVSSPNSDGIAPVRAP
jgi:hypothetical protein